MTSIKPIFKDGELPENLCLHQFTRVRMTILNENSKGPMYKGADFLWCKWCSKTVDEFGRRMPNFKK